MSKFKIGDHVVLRDGQEGKVVTMREGRVAPYGVHLYDRPEEPRWVSGRDAEHITKASVKRLEELKKAAELAESLDPKAIDALREFAKNNKSRQDKLEVERRLGKLEEAQERMIDILETIVEKLL